MLASSFTSAAKPNTSRFPDFLAPFRGMFGSRPSSHNSQPQPHFSPEPVRVYHSPKDNAGAESTKPFGGEQQGEYEDNGFRPFSPNGFGDASPASGIVYEEPQYSPQSQAQPQQQPRPFPRPQYQLQTVNRPPRQDGGSSQEYRRPFGGGKNEVRGPGGRGNGPRPGGFSDFSFNTPDFNQPLAQPQHSPVGPGGPGQGPRPRFPPQGHGGPRPFQGPPRPAHDFGGPSHQGHPGQGRPFTPSTPVSADGFSPEVEVFPESFEPGPRGAREPQIITLDDIQNQNGIEGSSNGSPNFDDIYRPPSPHHGSGPANAHTRQVPAFITPGNRNPVYQSNPLRPPGSGLRPFTSSQPFTHSQTYPSSSEETPFFQESQQTKQFAFRPSRPIRRPAADPSTSGEPAPQVSSTPPTSSTEEVHYGRPMMMSASSSPAVVKKVRVHKKPHHSNSHSQHPHQHQHQHQQQQHQQQQQQHQHQQPSPSAPPPSPSPSTPVAQAQPILLSSPKIPNMVRSPSVQNSVTDEYEPQQGCRCRLD